MSKQTYDICPHCLADIRVELDKKFSGGSTDWEPNFLHQCPNCGALLSVMLSVEYHFLLEEPKLKYRGGQ